MSTRDQLDRLLRDPRRVLSEIGKFVAKRADPANPDPLDVSSAINASSSMRPAFSVDSDGRELTIGPAAVVSSRARVLPAVRGQGRDHRFVLPRLREVELTQADAGALARVLHAAAEGST